MEDENDKPKLKLSIEGFDPLGLKSLGEISKEVVEFGLDGAKEFLKFTCKPLLEEFGLLARDQFTNWRLSNIIKMLEKAKGKLQYDPEKEKLIIDPRVAFQIVEHASTISNETLQEMWAGLFASSCQKYEEDENIIFIDVLKKLTSSQVKLLNYLCRNCGKSINYMDLPNLSENGSVSIGIVTLDYTDLLSIMETNSRLKVELEINSLENGGLILPGSLRITSPLFNELMAKNQTPLRPSLMAIRLYIKCQGSSSSPFNYFLPQITDYYFNLFTDCPKPQKENFLSFIHESAIYGETFKNEIEFGSPGIKLKNSNWIALSYDELNNRLRAYIIYRFIIGVDKVYPVELNNKPFGVFSYKAGFEKN